MSELRVAVEGHAGCITLDRPQVLNALSLSMIEQMHAALDAFEADERVQRIVLDSTSPKAFCAGGDIRAVATLAAQGRQEDALRFLAVEYALDHRVAQMRKPYVSLIDGIAMGGGLGISVHGRFRVVTERAVLAMPETIIGFFPDVGSSFFLSRLPSQAGTWLGLTGARISGADAAAIGLATHFVSSHRFGALREALVTSGCETETVLAQFREEPQSYRLRALLPRIEHCFGADGIDEIKARLSREASDWARETHAQLEAASPMSLDLTLRLLREGASSTLAECFARELEAGRLCVHHPDLVEGVRAALVDKDRQPRWQPFAPSVSNLHSNPEGAPR